MQSKSIQFKYTITKTKSKTEYKCNMYNMQQLFIGFDQFDILLFINNKSNTINCGKDKYPV